MYFQPYQYTDTVVDMLHCGKQCLNVQIILLMWIIASLNKESFAMWNIASLRLLRCKYISS